MNHIATITATLTTLVAVSATASASVTLASSTFTTGDEGWMTHVGGGGASGAVDWSPAGGAPDGYISYDDVTSQGYEFFSAPSSYLVNVNNGTNDFSEAVGNGGVSFEWAATLGGAAQTLQVAFRSGYLAGSTIWADVPATANGQWGSYDLAFDATTLWMFDAGFGSSVATTVDLMGVLSSLDGMFITADTMPGMDGLCALDNPTIYSVPAPGAVVLLGLASIVGARRRRD
jgi:hypothetical protein